MANIDAQAGMNRMLGWSSYAPGMCLEAVYVAYGSHQSIGPHAGQYPYALKAWEYSEQRHTDGNVPAGAPVFLTAGGNGYGHICISTGGRGVVSTDTPSSGRVGRSTIDALCAAWGRSYLGYTTDFLGHQLVNLGGGGGGGGGVSGNIVPGRPTQQIQALVGAAQDGIYGPDTTAKVKAWQGAHGLTADGIWGPLSDAVGFPPAPASGNLQRGSTGARVSALQSGLNRVFPAYSKLGVDGQFGPATEGVVKEFQRRVGITADGIVGPVTTQKLNSFGVSF